MGRLLCLDVDEWADLLWMSMSGNLWKLMDMQIYFLWVSTNGYIYFFKKKKKLFKGKEDEWAQLLYLDVDG